MPLSDSQDKDPAMLGSSGYDRTPLDAYFTPDSAIDSLLAVIEDDLPSYKVWEPCCGDGAISKRLADLAQEIVSTDIAAYDGFEVDGLFDFTKIVTEEKRKAAFEQFNAAYEAPVAERTEADEQVLATGGEKLFSMQDIADLKGFMPDCIITNPPYGEDAEIFARHAIRLMESQKGIVMFLCRHEWDCAKGRNDLFNHPAFAMKITIQHRPRWIRGSKGAPRHNYAWYIWNHLKPVVAKPELVYVR